MRYQDNMEATHHYNRKKNQYEKDIIKRAKKFKDELVSHKNLPSWLSDNNYIRDSHRPQIQSIFNCFMTIFRIHSETVNIWTHLLGSVLYLTIGVCYWLDKEHTLSKMDKFMFLIYFTGAVLCMSCSWIFHTLLCYSKKLGLILNKLDYCGISFLVMGSCIPWLYYSFYCDLYIQIIYLTFLVTLSCLVIFVSMLDRFATPKYRPVRAIVFIALGLSAIVPGIHGILKYGFAEANLRMSLPYTVSMALAYIGGATLYACRIPERLCPGKFDIIFQSHQIFHVCVLLGVILHHYGLHRSFIYATTKYDCVTNIKVIYS